MLNTSKLSTVEAYLTSPSIIKKYKELEAIKNGVATFTPDAYEIEEDWYENTLFISIYSGNICFEIKKDSVKDLCLSNPCGKEQKALIKRALAGETNLDIKIQDLNRWDWNNIGGEEWEEKNEEIQEWVDNAPCDLPYNFEDEVLIPIEDWNFDDATINWKS